MVQLLSAPVVLHCPALDTLPSVSDPTELAYFLDHELPMRFGSPLFSKLQMKYWELEQCKNRPFVIAIEAFFDDESLALSDSSLAQYLYGLRMSASWTPEGILKVQTDTVESHTIGEKCTASTILAGCVNRFCRFDSFSDC